MLIEGFPAGSWATNCYVVAAGPGEPALIIDPGQDSMRGIREIVEKHKLHPAAVLLTHGHMDHIWSVAPLGKEFEIPAMIHSKDRYRLADPAGSSLVAAREQLLAMTQGELELTEPEDIVIIENNTFMSLAGLELGFEHAPGHTEGSMIIRHTTPDAEVVFSGDVLFAGSIGRTDLPGGSSTDMQRTLESVMLPLPDQTVVFPGHGESTTMGVEKATNPYLRMPSNPHSTSTPYPTRGL